MEKENTLSVRNSVGRLVFVVLSIMFQVGWIAVLFLRLNRYSTIISLISSLLALCLVLMIYGEHTNAAFKMPWIIIILAFPVLGLCMFLLFGHPQGTRKMKLRFGAIDQSLKPHIQQDAKVFAELEAKNRAAANQCRYILNYAGYPVYQNTDVVFYRDAADGLDAQLAEFEKAERFIFLEYHAIEETYSFLRMRDVLANMVKKGVEVRIIYDDIGSVGYINHDFIKRMEALGILCRVFNPIIPVLNLFMNNRDHRKITVIDGTVGFTGGYNLADEYFNITHPYGHWKDTGIKLTGDAVASLTAMFLCMWNAMKQTDNDYRRYLPVSTWQAAETGYVQPFADSPLDNEAVGENVYLNLMKQAEYRLYIATPYLIISDEMTREIGLAAKRGVDVRVITPGIPDKKLVYRLTRSYYGSLVSQGVRIYEYTPGFLHEKQVLCDDQAAVIGTINMDYRSLYHHFENGVLLFRCSAVGDVADDFQNTLAVSTEVTEQYQYESTMLRLGQCILRLAAPLM